MTRSYLLFGLLAALCHSACGVVFNDKIKQDVGGVSLALLHDVGDSTSVKFGNPPDFDSQAWQFNTEGFSDDEAVITPLNSSKTLVCEKGSKCRLDLEESKQAFRVTRADGKKSVFTFQDIHTSLYVSRTSGNFLELTDVGSDSIYFQLEAIRASHQEI
ncbi:hypothetical protein N7451_001701 [Penicillium sp. IBT 35674x]|nr:hypothetical protein N7451_001701 [Penicillium sp. IBT 35674x]